MILFVLKKVLGLLLMPLTIIIILFTAGLAQMWFTRNRHRAKVMLTMTWLFFIFFSYGILSPRLLEKLEQSYPHLDLNTGRMKEISWVVVLAGDRNESMLRLVEGIRIQRKIPGSKLIVSGGRIFGPVSSAQIMRDAAVDLGVMPSEIILEDRSKDTKDEAGIIREMVKNDRIVLVTSAYHMPRSMGLFRGQGMLPLAAPADYHITPDRGLNPWMFFPGTANIINSEILIHELLGILTARIMGQMG